MNLDIKNYSGNCTALDDTTILNITSKRNQPLPILSSIDDISLIKKYSLDVPDTVELEGDVFNFFPNVSVLSENVVTYIAGYVVKKIKKTTFCLFCQSSLEELSEAMDDVRFKLLNHQNKGGLLRPSSDVIEICIIIEKRLRHIFELNDKKMPNEPNFFKTFVHEMFAVISDNNKVFSCLDEHMFNHSFMENPKTNLIKIIISVYARIRLNSFAKLQTEKLRGELIRKKLSKLILFSGQ